MAYPVWRRTTVPGDAASERRTRKAALFEKSKIFLLFLVMLAGVSSRHCTWSAAD
jgi:hypothetical protein